MTLPENIRIGPIDFSVIQVDVLTDESNTTKLNGHIKYNLSEIRIDAELEEQAARQVIWHEVVHGILTLGQIEHDERLVQIVSYGVMQVLRDNPWLRQP